ncbi:MULTISPECIES: hypothetical protein [Brasilonema]|uniref:hypothetical protein n=1 Tax=Brasilonema TaxID=383614 RepID=UPI001FE26324|nr:MULTISPECIES: hypothetical protein [Brasilonema]
MSISCGTELYNIPKGYEPVAAIAIGYPGESKSLPEQYQQRELSPRQRKSIETFVFTGSWGQTSPVVKY